MAQSSVGKWPTAVSIAACAALIIGVGVAFVKIGGEGSSPAQSIAVGEPAPGSNAQSAEQPAKPRGLADVDGDRIINADSEPGNWLEHGRTYDEQRFSPLDQINDKNVGQLGLAWSLETNTTRGLEASPIVVDGVIYTTLTWGVTIAVDARTGKELWRFDPEVPGEWGRYGCCDVVNRGVAVWKGRVYVASFDGRLFALDAKDGSVVWKVNTVPGAPYTSTGAPRIVKGMVMIGNGGAEYGVRGYLTAYDAETGKQVWRFYTVPGDPSKPVENPELTKAIPTWKGGEWWKLGGGGTPWDSMVFDPKLNTLYVGTGNGSPWTRAIRSPGGGDNLYLSSILALDPDTGKMKWYYQETPGDNWDYTSTQPIILADLPYGGKVRKLLLHAPKNGFFYVLDRETGELLSANAYAITTWASHVDLKTGRPVENPKLAYDKVGQWVQPSANGAHNWHPMAFNPKTGLVYIPVQELPLFYSLSDEWKTKHHFTPEKNWWNLGLSYADLIDAIKALGDVPPSKGYLRAWDPVAGKVKWEVTYPAPLNGGVLTTAGNLVFQGTADGHLYAYKADTGERVWQQDVQIGIVAPPVTYEVDGVQYVAVLAGWGGVNITSGDARTSAAAKYGNNGRLLVYKIGGTDQLQKLALRDQTIPAWPPLTADAATVRKGEVSFTQHCSFCHGTMVVSPGVIPDLRRLDENKRAHFQDIVRGGILKDNGMASFGDLISKEEADAILAYIQKRALEDRARQAPVR
jgi:quinohemoprotein ethanol dehydrogenase